MKLSKQNASIDRERMADLTANELELYRSRSPRSAERYQRARASLLAGVPMSWMLKWAGAFPIEAEAGAFPIFGSRARGSRLVDVDGNEYVDFCLGRHGRHDRSLAGGADRRTGSRARGWLDLHAADGLGDRGGGTVGEALRAGQMAVHGLGDRREPFLDPSCPGTDRAAEDPGLQLLATTARVDEVFASLDAPATS